jgi:molecular chaperone GrpE
MENNEIKKEPLAEDTAEAQAPAEDTAAEKDTADKKEKKADKKAKAELLRAEEEIARLAAALEEEKDKYLRLAAEYDNFRRRSAKEKDGIYADAMCDAVKEILPLLDNLGRAGQFTEAEKVAEGLSLMYKMSDAMLEKMGVTRFGAKGDKFDPAWHNAVMHADDEAFGENEITDVFEIGYRRGDKVIRFAMVKVAN